jgi:hypothetical protein
MQSIPIGDGRTVKLGRRRPDFSKPRARLRLSKYLKAPTPPPAVDYAAKASASLSRMYLNDRFGDCVIAGKAHAIGVWSANESGTPILATDDEIYAAYQGICGPGDNGCVITHVLDTLRDRGIVLGGKARRIDGYVDVDWTNQVEVQVAILLFGAVTIGVNLPAAWQGAAKVWDVTNTGIVGGHDVTLVGYDAARVTVSTWGSTRDLTWRALTSRRWVEEAYVMLSPDWYAADGISPSGFDAAALKADLEAIRNGEIPPITPPVPPVPTPAVAGTIQIDPDARTISLPKGWGMVDYGGLNEIRIDPAGKGLAFPFAQWKGSVRTG